MNLEFRAYNKKHKIMIYPDGDGYMNILTGLNGKLYQYSNNMLSEDISDDWIFLTWTGLYDKHGNNPKIYHGDILDCPMPDDVEDYPYTWFERGIVRYYPQYARFGLEFYSPFGGEGYTGKDQDISNYVDSGWRLIGNIFENPELVVGYDEQI